MRVDVALVLSALSLAVSTADFFASRARSKRLEDRESVIEAKESKLEKAVEALADKRRPYTKTVYESYTRN
jgi:uncharacterized membrane protein YgcG